jgi:hypothetical protein
MTRPVWQTYVYGMMVFWVIQGMSWFTQGKVWYFGDSKTGVIEAFHVVLLQVPVDFLSHLEYRLNDLRYILVAGSGPGHTSWVICLSLFLNFDTGRCFGIGSWVEVLTHWLQSRYSSFDIATPLVQ